MDSKGPDEERFDARCLHKTSGILSREQQNDPKTPAGNFGQLNAARVKPSGCSERPTSPNSMNWIQAVSSSTHVALQATRSSQAVNLLKQGGIGLVPFSATPSTPSLARLQLSHSDRTLAHRIPIFVNCCGTVSSTSS